ncbi:MAG: hypothetical protein E7554_01935 [Ruminococcaceae bacterium]|nr:hypothetical protein [Oscillospiraceae bacterium]
MAKTKTEPAAAPESTAPVEETVVEAASSAATAQETSAAASVSDGLTDAKIDKEARSVKAILDARPKCTVKILDRDALESGRTVPPHPVSINGYVFRIPYNKEVEVPDRVAEILRRQNLIP